MSKSDATCALCGKLAGTNKDCENCKNLHKVTAAFQLGGKPAVFIDDDPEKVSKLICQKLIQLGVPRRPANALNVEVGQPLDRCRLKTPEHWGDADPEAARWLLSGGSPLVLGMCTPNNCPHERRLIAPPLPGAPGQESAGDPMAHRTDILLAVQNTLTLLETHAFLTSFVRANPRWDGAQVADVLDALLERDEHLEITEPIHENFGERVSEPSLLSACAITVYYVTGRPPAPNWGVVWDLIERTRKQLQKQTEPV
jgi:hypothetical protein